MDNQLPKKYVLLNTKTKKYFCGFVPTNKPVWTDILTDATEYDERDGQQVRCRLNNNYSPAQPCILVLAKRLKPAD